MEASRKLLLSSCLLGENPEETILSFLLQKLHQLLQILPNAWEFLVDKFNQILPPDTRSQTFSHWAHVALARGLPVALVVLLLYCCCCRCCCKRGGGAGRMMKAPGRGGAVMRRAIFEGNPRGYFLNLRAKNDILF